MSIEPSTFVGKRGKGHMTHLLQFPKASSSQEHVSHWLDTLYRCPPQQKASPPTYRNMCTMVLLWRALRCFKTCIKYATVSRGRLDCDDKKKWWTNPVYLLWSCRCRSCPPCPRQTPSEGKTQSRPFPVPFLPKAQNSHVIWQKPHHHRKSWWQLISLTMTLRTQHLLAELLVSCVAWLGCWNSPAAWTPASPQWSLCQLLQWRARCWPSGSGASWTPRLTGEDLGRKKKSQMS